MNNNDNEKSTSIMIDDISTVNFGRNTLITD